MVPHRPARCKPGVGEEGGQEGGARRVVAGGSWQEGRGRRALMTRGVSGLGLGLGSGEVCRESSGLGLGQGRGAGGECSPASP